MLVDNHGVLVKPVDSDCNFEALDASDYFHYRQARNDSHKEAISLVIRGVKRLMIAPSTCTIGALRIFR
jgi:hypothetical protein